MTTPFSQLVASRRSVRKFDKGHDFDHHAVERALELAALSPNSSNMQLWEFHRIKSEDLLSQMTPLCMHQNAAASASELVAFVTTPDKWQQRAKINAKQVRSNFAGREESKAAKKAFVYYEKLIPTLYNNDRFGLKGALRRIYCWWTGRSKPMVREVSKADVRVTLHKSVSLAAMSFIYSMQEQGYDTCTMEGFDSKRVKALLGIPSHYEIAMIVACGKGLEEGVYGERQRVALSSLTHIH